MKNGLERTKQIVVSSLFLIVLTVSIFVVLGPLGVDRAHSYENMHLYLNERKDSLDCVLIGASNVHASWQPLFAWSMYGITTWNYSVDGLRADAVKPLIIEARKTQPDAVYLINLNLYTKTTKLNLKQAHWLLDYMPWSLNKIRLINLIADNSSFSIQERIGLFFPFISFHSRWDSLGAWVFEAGEQYKSSLHDKYFYNTIYDASKEYNVYSSKAKGSLSDDIMTCMTDLLEYCDQNNVKVAFFSSPAVENEIELGKMNELEDYLISNGYPCIDLLKEYNSIYMDLQQDFFNSKHTNVHGSIKICTYLGQYLINHYGFIDKRGQKGWESWDQSSEAYINFLTPYILPFEWGQARVNLSAPAQKKLSVDGQQITVSWKESEDVEQYEIYRSDGTHWEFVAETDQLEYIDEGLKAATKYTYTVVPVVVQEGVKYYGHFNVKGVSATTGGTKE